MPNGRAVLITGVKDTIRMVNAEYGRKRAAIHRQCIGIGEDLLRKAQSNAPVLTGILVSSMTQQVIDRGRGRGFVIDVTAGDKVYARRMHESHYTAHDPHGNITSGGGFWTDSAGNKHGRKYLTRAVDENIEKYKAALAALGDR